MIRGLIDFEVKDNLDLFLGNASSRHILGLKIDELAQSNGIEVIKEVCEGWPFLTDPRIHEAYGDRIESLFAMDPAKVLQHTLRTGLFAEYAWPIYEETAAQLKERSGGEKLSARASYPAAALVSDQHVAVVDGNRVVCVGGLAVSDGYVHSVHTVGDDVLVFFDDDSLMWLRTNQMLAQRGEQALRIGLVFAPHA